MENIIGYLSGNVKLELYYEETEFGYSLCKYELSIKKNEKEWQLLPQAILLDIAAALGFKDEPELYKNLFELLMEVTDNGPPW